ncbi:unnamed protein product [Linum tenue]|uniref:Uncharacterized protein n=1 Tax=Linum tenue TaxID=586396 RepID=A0AAV0L7H0_9ROSI|nr:unnamed protein product [Linum tenue]
MMRSMHMGNSAPARGIAAIVGVGPKLGRSVARKFAHEGYTVAILARDLGRLSMFAEEIAREEKAQVFAIRIDCSDSRSIREAFEGVLSLGFVEVLVYNAYCPAALQPTNFADVSLAAFERSLAVSSVGAFLCAQQVIPGMVERRKGTILFTGCAASLNGIPGFSDLCCGKFALRGLSQCLAREFQALGVHIAHVVIDGLVGSPRGPSSTSPSTGSTTGGGWWQRTAVVGEQLVQRQQVEGEVVVDGGGPPEPMMMMMDPDSLAQTYWHLHVQDRTCWTQEIDLRPSHSQQ